MLAVLVVSLIVGIGPVDYLVEQRGDRRAPDVEWLYSGVTNT
jgi:hypothetical protein